MPLKPGIGIGVVLKVTFGAAAAVPAKASVSRTAGSARAHALRIFRPAFGTALI
ncbi:MAG TPA: hypothetical protein VLA79_12275 [Polyangia bacterium]|nr:hypothetical protein [Polyangia bacterium]